jgi:hypothetical protein
MKQRSLAYTKAVLTDFIEKANLKFGNLYDYSLVRDTPNLSSKVKIICPIHGVFEKFRGHHLKGQGCKKCSCEKKSKAHLSNTTEFVQKAKEIWGDFYDYSKVEYKTARERVTVICPHHGEFYVSPNHHLGGGGCQRCSSFSHGERLILSALEERGVEYEKEKTFPGLTGKAGRSYRFDFYLPLQNAIIEYHGKQHFKTVKYFESDESCLKERQRIDKLKKDFCEERGIRYLMISYKEKRMISSIVSEFLESTNFSSQ